MIFIYHFDTGGITLEIYGKRNLAADKWEWCATCKSPKGATA